MFKTVESFNELMQVVTADRFITGEGASTADRFPVRFVLFDNFSDCCSFVEEIMHIGHIQIQRIDDWMDSDYPDTMITHKRLADRIYQLILNNPTEYRIIMPFSEIARFYNNNPDQAEFNSLIDTIKGYDSLASGNQYKQRVYIPIVGLEGKMQHFRDDSQSFIWYYHNIDRQLDYRLILTDKTTFGVQGLESKYNIADTFLNWLGFWQYPELKRNIISTSHSIFSHEKFAKPDNAFSYCPCRNAHEFLTVGLNLDVKCIAYREEDSLYWEQLAQRIDIRTFKFDSFFNEQFGIFNLADYKVFFEAWFKNKQPFMRWLLSNYYIYKFNNKGYICSVLAQLEDYSDLAFTKALALSIFNIEGKEQFIEERRIGLEIAIANGMELPPEAQSRLVSLIKTDADENGYSSAVRFLSDLSTAEKELSIIWYAQGKITINDLKKVYPDLYYYLIPTSLPVEDLWVLEYIDEYKKAKVTNKYTDKIKEFIDNKNKNTLEHHKWSNRFSTTRTVMHGRNDIQHYCWIDGLGIDWISFIQHIVKDVEQDGYYLNEAYIATAKLPTRTSINRKDIEILADDKFEKIGDIDNVSHSCRQYPSYIIDDLELVKVKIKKLLLEHPGEKIAIVSDHGITYLSQLCQGFNLQGYQSDHWGRIAETTKSPSQIVADDKYRIITLENESNTFLCALKHESLLKKIPDGMGAHGGCTPEEQLVPILVISPEKDTIQWNASLNNGILNELDPILHFSIEGLSAGQVPMAEYDGVMYPLSKEQDNCYISGRITLRKDATKVILHIGQHCKEFTVSIKMAVQEDDPFMF